MSSKESYSHVETLEWVHLLFTINTSKNSYDRIYLKRPGECIFPALWTLKHLMRINIDKIQTIVCSHVPYIRYSLFIQGFESWEFVSLCGGIGRWCEYLRVGDGIGSLGHRGHCSEKATLFSVKEFSRIQIHMASAWALIFFPSQS